MSFNCDNCLDTGRAIIGRGIDGSITHSDYLDCHQCNAASEIAARQASVCMQRLGDSSEVKNNVDEWARRRAIEDLLEDGEFVVSASPVGAKAVVGVPRQITDAEMLDAVKAYVAAGKRGLGLMDALKCAVEAVLASSPALPEQGWIRVKDELPEIGRAVFAYRPTAPLTEDPYFKVTFRTGHVKTDWQGTQHDFDCLVAPSHWQYATPPAAKEQEKQNG